MTSISGPYSGNVSPAESARPAGRRLSALHLIGLLIILMPFVVSGSLLQAMGWQYNGGGSELEKFHPATYLVFVWFACALFFDRSFRSSVFTILSRDRALTSFAFTAGCAAAYAILIKGVSIAPFVETLGSMIVILVIMVSLPERAITVLRTAIDAVMVFSIVMIVAEYYLRQTFIPIYTGDTVYTGELLASLNRPAGLFGHPLAAASFLCTYAVLCIISLPSRISPRTYVRPVLALLALGAATTTGGRTSVVTGIFLLALYFLSSGAWAAMSGRLARSNLIVVPLIALLGVLAIPVLFELGIFDLLLFRFGNDNGSAIAREYALQILSSVPFDDLWFGIQPAEMATLQAGYGLVAIEITWVNYILICGLVFTIPFFFTYLLFLFRSLPRYCAPPIYLISLFYFILSFSSNGLWTKSTGFAASMAMAIAFLRTPRSTAN